MAEQGEISTGFPKNALQQQGFGYSDKWSKEELMAHDNVSIKVQDERGEKEMVAKKAKLEVAQKLKTMGLSNKDIKEATGLSDDEINDL